VEQTWDLWFPDAGATGVPFARTVVDSAVAGDRVLVHAAPPALEVTVRDATGAVVARGERLERGAPGPMCALVLRGDRVELEDGWPTDADLGRLVLLPGGETGVLRSWWHSDDRTAWRWTVEFANSV
jgi:hypothetical protein